MTIISKRKRTEFVYSRLKIS